MAKNFEIRYAPDQWGNQYVNQGGAYGGLHVQAPINQLGPNFSPALSNVILRNNQIRSRWPLKQFLPSPDGNPILGMGSFADSGIPPNFHTVAVTSGGLFELPSNALALWNGGLGSNPWTAIPSSASHATGTQLYIRCFNNVIYYTGFNGATGQGHTCAYDGTTFKLDAAFLGATNPPVGSQARIGAKYLGDLDQHIILASTVETTGSGPFITQAFPQRIRWSNVAPNPYGAGAFGSTFGTTAFTFDPTVNVNAGFNDFIDVPDTITGLLMLGRVGYVLRDNGITEMSPTGNGLAPFDFNHLWASQHGVGNIFANTIAQYGLMAIGIAEDNIYKFTPSSVTPIGGGARDAIMADLFASSNPNPLVCLVHTMQLSYIYLSYLLYIPGTSKFYIFSLEDNNWSVIDASAEAVTLLSRPEHCLVGDQTLTYGPAI